MDKNLAKRNVSFSEALNSLFGHVVSFSIF